MAKRISDLTQVNTATDNDLLELAIVDGESPTGYSSRSIRVGDLPGGTGGAVCRTEFNQTLDSNENTIYLRISYDDLTSGCHIGPLDPNTLVGATFRVSLVVSYVETPSISSAYGFTQADVLFDPNDYSYMKFMSSKGKGNGAPDALPYFPALSDPPPSGFYPVIYDVSTYDDGFDKGVEFIVFLATSESEFPNEFQLKGYVDTTTAGYDAA